MHSMRDSTCTHEIAIQGYLSNITPYSLLSHIISLITLLYLSIRMVLTLFPSSSLPAGEIGGAVGGSSYYNNRLRCI